MQYGWKPLFKNMDKQTKALLCNFFLYLYEQKRSDGFSPYFSLIRAVKKSVGADLFSADPLMLSNN
jgi:hypothetical protein